MVFPPILRLLVDTYGVRCDLAFICKILLNLCVAGALVGPITFYEDLQKFAKQEQNNQIWSTNSGTHKKRSPRDDNGNQYMNHLNHGITGKKNHRFATKLSI